MWGKSGKDQKFNLAKKEKRKKEEEGEKKMQVLQIRNACRNELNELNELCMMPCRKASIASPPSACLQTDDYLLLCNQNDVQYASV